MKFNQNFIFRYRPRRNQYLTTKKVLQELVNLPSDSDISGASDDSDLDETYVPKDKIRESSDDEEEKVVEHVGDVGEVAELPVDIGDNIPELPTQLGHLLDIDNLPEELLDLRDVPIESPQAQKNRREGRAMLSPPESGFQKINYPRICRAVVFHQNI